MKYKRKSRGGWHSPSFAHCFFAICFFAVFANLLPSCITPKKAERDYFVVSNYYLLEQMMEVSFPDAKHDLLAQLRLEGENGVLLGLHPLSQSPIFRVEAKDGQVSSQWYVELERKFDQEMMNSLQEILQGKRQIMAEQKYDFRYGHFWVRSIQDHAGCYFPKHIHLRFKDQKISIKLETLSVSCTKSAL